MTHPPTTPLTRQQLDEQPAGAVVIDAQGTAWQVDGLHQWWTPGHTQPIDSLALTEDYQPTTVAWTPTT